ncbi:MAG: hypothetical protein A2583_03270 [Bdellovibrionales bacterium RIFOXYD1_FULL_53_11]|nr:MAG: hypothetical protein A2583_03270 [Bdellovibrionales bacterium RIFOXYD1_FULL_53_11]
MAADMKTLVVVLTYKRPELLQQLLKQLTGYMNIDIVVFDDDPDTTNNLAPVVEHHVASINHGKKLFWQWINHIFEELRVRPVYDRYVFLPDDMKLCKDFLDRCEERWQTLPNDKIALNLFVDHRAGQANWTCRLPVRYNTLVEETWWIDGCFYAERAFFEKLDWKIHPILTRWDTLSAGVPMGSGVWSQATRRLHEQALRMFRSWQSLTLHLGVVSMMNPIGRAKYPFTTVRWIDV